ncbi:Cysteine synthase [Propionibacterium freudenreichii]|uniref:O-acetylserine sulfhydrylase n=1 Tax=Propionibacterium freudenreichii subsp. freudenreichii TaxID=66712 RepID=A0A0B7NYH6_PROFF|nr:Cysteine synthase [Propionibacterium freudenreichii subsp. freudenreichii]CEG86808.1 Cysteine synthase (O-acetylserine sulfhydrylase) [Propionibacterium freudenreichii]CEG89386.1 Cysteine synthase (O-acetylserine sulfhydrylase) [Propionibacterium freudenreichii]CEG98281.1 Cysteine synthase (O-acetylserine sulfhydrylase) [Propionibacterium freudenreichii]CEI22665.1 Cysteine synthase (O-acetylserine sulfhydrylase) [Propionibacterium freudenreichii]
MKDRTALSMVRAAERDARLAKGGTIVEATSGNTGISLAWLGGVLGYRVIIVVPDDQSIERRALIEALGAEIVLTPGKGGMPAAGARAAEIVASTPGAWLAGQGGNPANPAAHYATTGPEIWEQTDGHVDWFVSAVGTGGTISGAGRFLRERNPGLRIVAVEPAESAVLNGGQWHPHKIQGISGGPAAAPVTDLALIDQTLDIPQAEALDTTRELMRHAGLAVGISSGAAVAAARILAARPETAGQVIVTIIADTAERYYSTDLFDHHTAATPEGTAQ